MSRARTIVAANVLVYINNLQFGKVRSFSFTSQTPRDPINGIDSLDPFELAPTTTRITARMGLYRTLGDAGAEGAGLTTDYDNLSKEKYFSVVLVERSSDTVIFRADFCSVNSQTWDIVSRELVTGTVEFEALNWSNEIKPMTA
jgi:hypothetical protein